MSGRGRSRRRISRRPRKGIAKVQIRAAQGRDYHTAACMRALISPSRGPTPFPDRMRCVLTFSNSYLLLLNNSATPGRQQYAMNSLYDPDFTGSGAQPEYFDQLAALYNRYRVYGSAIKVTMIPFNTTGSQSNIPVNVVLVPSAQSLASYGIEEALGLPRAQNRVSTGNMDYKNQTMVASHSVSEILGVKDVEGADRLQAQVSSSPAEECLWSIVARSADNTTLAYLAISVRITYDAEFFDRAVATQSLLQEKKEKKHLEEIKKELKDIEAYQKLHKTFEPVEMKEIGSRLPTLSNGEVHEKWLKLREADELARETPKSRPPSKK